MEALTAVTVCALTAYDMVKGVDKSVYIKNISLLEKKGGKSGDYKILNFIINAFNRNKIKVISHTKYCKYITLYKNVTKAKPSSNNYRDLKVAIKLINSLNTNDLGQGIIVENHRVMMVECAFGTDVMLKNFEKQKIKKAYPILIKTTKKYQDLIIDLPTIGLETINN